jgi:dehydrogenase/reductase SDR family member 12
MRLHETRQIDRSLEDVFAFTADFSNIEQWDPGVASSRRSDDGPLGVGSRFDLEVVFGRSQLPMTYEITTYEPPHRVVLTGTGDTIEAVDDIVFETRDGGTHVDYTADLTFRGWVRLIAPLISPVMRRVGERALDGLVAKLQQ